MHWKSIRNARTGKLGLFLPAGYCSVSGLPSVNSIAMADCEV